MAIIRTQHLPAATPRHSLTNKRIQLDRDGFNWGPWSISERRVVYEYVNIWIHVHGLDAFCTKKWPRGHFMLLAHKVNEINAANREVTAPRSCVGVKTEICTLGQGRLGPLFKLAKRSEILMRKIKAGEVVEKDERFPKMAIPVPMVVNGVYTIENSREEGTKKRICEDSGTGSEAVAEEAKRQRVGESDSGLRTAETAAAKKQKKEKIVKLSVNWTRFHVSMDSQMAVLEDGEVYESLLDNSEGLEVRREKAKNEQA